jgi:hypothetical protein
VLSAMCALQTGQIHMSVIHETTERKNGSGDEPSIAQAPAIIIKMGKKKRRQARRIRKGGGPLQSHIDRAVDYVSDTLEDDKKEKVIVPVVLLYEIKKKRKRRRRGWGWF